VDSTGRGKWKTHRANTIRLRRPKHVAGWILSMKGGSRRGVRYRNGSPPFRLQALSSLPGAGRRVDEGG